MIFLLRRCHLQPKLSAAVGLRVAAPRPPPSFSRGFHLSVLWISPNHPEDQVKNLCVRQRASAFLMSQPRGRGSLAATAATAARFGKSCRDGGSPLCSREGFQAGSRSLVPLIQQVPGEGRAGSDEPPAEQRRQPALLPAGCWRIRKSSWLSSPRTSGPAVMRGSGRRGSWTTWKPSLRLSYRYNL